MTNIEWVALPRISTIFVSVLFLGYFRSTAQIHTMHWIAKAIRLCGNYSGAWIWFDRNHNNFIHISILSICSYTYWPKPSANHSNEINDWTQIIYWWPFSEALPFFGRQTKSCSLWLKWCILFSWTRKKKNESIDPHAMEYFTHFYFAFRKCTKQRFHHDSLQKLSSSVSN